MSFQTQYGTPIVPTLADLRAINTQSQPLQFSLLYLAGGASSFDGMQGYFVYEPAATAADDGVDTIISNWNASGKGAWVRVTPGAGGQGQIDPETNNYTVTSADVLAGATIEINAAAAPITVTFPVNLPAGRRVLIVKTDNTANPVVITADGATPVDAIVTPANGANMSGRFVWTNGANLRSVGAG